MKSQKKIITKRLKIITTFILISALLFNNMFLENVFAKSYYKVVNYKTTHVFTVPEGGWSSIMIWINYMERYTKQKNSKNKFYNRDLFYAYRTAYATERPSFSIGKVKHIDGNGKTLHTFKKWKPCDALSDGTWDFFCCDRNEKNKNYSKATKCKAQVNYSVYCKGANIPVRGNTVKLNLKTN
ncbi:MAG: hypothetical protein HFG29_00545 [Eubacterium sp.]|nr:hypothetical protein [Eubacterium sp.]